MIISHKHKFIFIKTKKTAGTSIEIGLSRICDDGDIITQIDKKDELVRKRFSGRTFQNTLIPFLRYGIKDWFRVLRHGRRLRYTNHMTASQVKRYLSDEIWRDYFKFCFERHPIQKSISHFNWKGGSDNYGSFERYLFSKDIEMIKGAHYYKNEKNECLVDKVYKLEELSLALDNLAENLKIESDSLYLPPERTKKSNKDLFVNPEIIKDKYFEKFKEIFQTEFEELYKTNC